MPYANRSDLLAQRKRYYLKNRDEILSASKGRYRSDPESHKATARKWYEENKDLQHRRNRASRYGLTPELLEVKFQEQKGLCGLCHKPLAKKFFVDHDHVSKRVRSLLHPRCNIGLGYVENASFKDLAERYLRRFK